MASDKTAMRRELLQALSRALKELRTEHAEITQGELAEQIGMDRSYWGDIERGERNITLVSLYQLAEALGVTPLALFMSVDKHYRKVARGKAPQIVLTPEMKRLRAWMERRGVPMWFTDTRQKTLFVNQATLDWMGVTFEQLAGDGWRAFIHPDDREGYFTSSAKAFRLGHPYISHYRVMAKGQYIYIQQAANPQFTRKGLCYGFLGAMSPALPGDLAMDEPEPKPPKKRKT